MYIIIGGIFLLIGVFIGMIGLYVWIRYKFYKNFKF